MRDNNPLLRAISSNLFWVGLVLAGLLLFNAFFTAGFFVVEIRDGRLYGSLIDVLDRAAPIMLVSLGMTLVIATGGVDLSVGAIMAIAGAVAAGLIVQPEKCVLSRLQLPATFEVAIAGALAVSLLAGLANGILVAFLKVQPIVATLVLMVAGRGVAQLLVEGQIITFKEPHFAYLGNGALFGLPVTISIVVVTYLIAAGLARGTALGLFVEAVGDNATASRYAGIPIGQIKLLAYVLSGFCSGVAGVLVAADITAADANNAGMYAELDAILAVVLGGTALTGGRFYLAGTIVGALLIQTLTTTILMQGLPIEYTLLTKAIVIVAVCLLQAPLFRARVMRGWEFYRRRMRRLPA